MKHLRQYIRQTLIEQNVLAQGMCFPFAYQKAEEWFEQHYTPPSDPDSYGKKHPDLNDKSKFKVVHGTVTDKWKTPVKPVVHGWVEMGDLVFDDQTQHTKPDGVNKEFYYEMFQPEVYKEFTAEEAVNNCIMKGGEGPWDDDLYAMMQKRDAWINDGLIRERTNQNTLMRDVDDILDDAIRDAAPEIVRDIREREVDEDIDEFINGALLGSWEANTQSYPDPPIVGSDAEVGDTAEVTEMYVLGYNWGWDNPNKIEGGETIPDTIRAEMIEYALENFKSRVTEEFVINALEKSLNYIKKQMGDVHHLLMKAKEKFGWKFAPILVSIEVIEHAVLPTILGAINPIFYGLTAVPTVEILAASVLAIAKARMPSIAEPEIPPGHLDWYEEEYLGTNEGLLRTVIRELLNNPSGVHEVAKRDYKEEYKKYHSTTKAKKDRVKRNKNRRQFERDGKVSKGDGKEIDHKKPLSKGGGNGNNNLRVVDRKTNRKKGTK